MKVLRSNETLGKGRVILKMQHGTDTLGQRIQTLPEPVDEDHVWAADSDSLFP